MDRVYVRCRRKPGFTRFLELVCAPLLVWTTAGCARDSVHVVAAFRRGLGEQRESVKFEVRFEGMAE